MVSQDCLAMIAPDVLLKDLSMSMKVSMAKPPGPAWTFDDTAVFMDRPGW